MAALGLLSALPLILAAVSLWRPGFRPAHATLWAVPVFIAIAHLPLWIEHRFALPAQPFLWGLAAMPLAGRPARAQAAR